MPAAPGGRENASGSAAETDMHNAGVAILIVHTV
jgi:hypothetical protein